MALSHVFFFVHRSKFLIERSEQMSEQAFVDLFQGFCAISGSPISSGRAEGTRYRMTLDSVAGGTTRTGYLHFCCWPCVRPSFPLNQNCSRRYWCWQLASRSGNAAPLQKPRPSIFSPASASDTDKLHELG